MALLRITALNAKMHDKEWLILRGDIVDHSFPLVFTESSKAIWRPPRATISQPSFCEIARLEETTGCHGETSIECHNFSLGRSKTWQFRLQGDSHSTAALEARHEFESERPNADSHVEI